MSKAAKQSIFILIFLLVGSLGFAGYSIFEKQKLEQVKGALERQLNESQDREKKSFNESTSLKDQLKKIEDEKNELESRAKKAEKQVEDLLAQVSQVTGDRDKWQSRVTEITKERDELVAKLKEKPPSAPAAEIVSAPPSTSSSETPKIVTPSPTSSDESQTPTASVEARPASDEQYWAGVLRDKAALEVKLAGMKQELSKSSVEVVELKQKNSDLQIELDSFKNKQDQISREIKYKEDLINNLSLELARSKNDKKFVADRVEKVDQENTELREQLKKLFLTKSSLEKSIVRISDEKDKLEKQVGQSESLIQSKIDEIWEIKDSIDKTFKNSKVPQGNGAVELPPIVVSAQGNAANFNEGASAPGLNAKVVSINQDNNFVIIDAGDNAGVKLGDALSVYRDSKYIARLEVIQTRKDIAAADIKEQWTKVKAGDLVR